MAYRQPPVPVLVQYSRTCTIGINDGSHSRQKVQRGASRVRLRLESGEPGIDRARFTSSENAVSLLYVVSGLFQRVLSAARRRLVTSGRYYRESLQLTKPP